ncbi:MAG: C4-type zinc ribbon domain-containing protein [Coriobacteriia bacterium]|nr:C4-type zinc ribbon domain-containing protein [Coriobacteriia bacterium]
MVGDASVTDAAEAARLMQLGETDIALVRLARELDELPVKTEILHARRKIKELEALLAKADAFVAAAEREVRRLEDEAAAIDEHIASTSAKAQAVAAADHKELHNLMREIDALARQKDKKETEAVAAMERVEAGAAKRTQIVAAIEAARATEAALIERYRIEGGELKQRIADLETRRAGLAARIEPALLARYEAVRSAKHGIGVGRFESGRCSVCHIDLPADKVQAIEASGPVSECPNCHRILVVGIEP